MKTASPCSTRRARQEADDEAGDAEADERGRVACGSRAALPRRSTGSVTRRAARSATVPWPASTASGSTSSHGTSTKARSWARGCGSTIRGSSSETIPSKSTMSMSMVRSPQRSSRTRPRASSTPLTAVSSASGSRACRIEGDGVQVRGRVGIDALRLERRRLVQPRHRANVDPGLRASSASTAAWMVAARSPRLLPKASTAGTPRASARACRWAPRSRPAPQRCARRHRRTARSIGA